MPLDMEVGLHPGDIVLDGDPAPQKRWHIPHAQFSAQVYCGQMAVWIKMQLGMEAGLGPCHIVLEGTQLPHKRGQSPQFSADVCCGQTAGRIEMPFGTDVGLGPDHIVSDGDPGTQLPPPPPHTTFVVIKNLEKDLRIRIECQEEFGGK